VRVGRPDQLGDVRWAAPEMVGQPQPRRQPDCARQTKAVHDAESEPVGFAAVGLDQPVDLM
jgi:hypothetical protein